jgi:hypothetical protein
MPFLASSIIQLASSPPAFYDKNPGMKIVPETLTVGNKVICVRDEIWHNSGSAYLANTAYCCPKCGQIWGRRSYGEDVPWDFVVRPCETHGGGSLVFSEFEWEHLLDEGFAEYFPINWLAYELFLIVRRYP